MLSIDVLVTNYNHGRFVIEAVASALAQRRAPARVVVIDDGSTDGSPELLRARYADDPRVLLHFGVNTGQLGAFQQGAALIDAGIVAFLDADDVWEPGYLDAIGTLYDGRPDVDFIFSDLLFFGDASGRSRFGDAPRDLGYTALSTWMDGPWEGGATSGISMRRGWALRVLDLPARFRAIWRISADNVLVFGAAVLGARKYYLPTGAVRYRVHDANGWWHGRDQEAGFPSRLRTRALINHFARDMAMDARSLDLLMLEFESKPHPSRDEARRYARIAMAGGGSLPRRLRIAAAIMARQSRLRRES